MEKLRLSRVASTRVLAEELETVALKGRALTTVFKKEVKDETQDGLVRILDDVMTDLEELIPTARALAHAPSAAVEPAALRDPLDQSRRGGERSDEMPQSKDIKQDVLDIAEKLNVVALKLRVVTTGLGEPQNDPLFNDGLEYILNDQLDAVESLTENLFELGGIKSEISAQKAA